MCGEYLQVVKTVNVELGSPPHVWRIPAGRQDRQRRTRITSTCVENTKAQTIKDEQE